MRNIRKKLMLCALAIFSAAVGIAQPTVLIPASGSTSVACGTNTVLKDNGGDNNYANNSNGYVVLHSSHTSVIQLIGTKNIDGNGDALYIYDGVGTGGTLLEVINGEGNIWQSYNPGQTITLAFVSNSTVTASGFNINVTYTGCCSPPTGDPNDFGQDVWNVYAFDGEWGTYFGYYVDSTLNFNTENRWAKTLSPSYASGYLGCALTTGAHSYKYKRKGFPAGVYTFNIAWTDQFKLFVNGTQVGGTQWNTGSNSNFWSGYLDENATVEARFLSWYNDSYGRINMDLAPPTYYRSITSGNWSDASTWQTSSDSIYWTNALAAPTVSENSVVVIQNGHTVSMNSNYNNTTALNNVYVLNDGILNQTGNTQPTIRFARLHISGTAVRNRINTSYAGAIVVQHNGIYDHAVNGGALPAATWEPNSTLLISGFTSNINFTSGDGQAFSNIVFNSTLNNNKDFSLGLEHGFSVAETLTVVQTGTGTLALTGTGSTQTVVANLIQNGGIVSINNNNSSLDRTLTIVNDMRLNGGTFDVAKDANNTSTLTIQGNLIVKGAASMINSRTTGIINLHQNLTNYGTINIGSTPVNFVGTSIQNIASTNALQLHSVTINKNAGEVVLNSITESFFNLQITHLLTMINGNINLNNNSIDLLSSGTIEGETDNARIYCDCEDGFVRRVMDVNATNTTYTFGNIGIIIKTNETTMGTTEVKRFNKSYMLDNGTPSVKRYFDVTPTTSNDSLNVDVTIKYLLAEVDPSMLSFTPLFDLYRSNNEGLTWQREYAYSDFANNTIEKKGLRSFDWIGSGAGDVSPLPVELLSFDASCETGRMSITWETASEANNDFFTVERSQDGLNWEVIEYVTGNGNSNTLATYQIWDNNAGVENYYRLSQTDYNGTSETFEIKAAGCAVKNQVSVSVFPNPVTYQMNVNVNAIASGTATLTLFNTAGSPVMQQQVRIDEGENLVNIQRSAQWNNGVYILQVSAPNFTQNIKVLFN